MKNTCLYTGLLSLFALTMLVGAHHDARAEKAAMAAPEPQPPLVIEKAEPKLSYQDFLAMRDKPDTVVIDAFELEPLFHVGAMSGSDKNIMTQEKLDRVLAKMIPDKNAPVVLYCRETFMPTRRVPATFVMSKTLNALGYTNVQDMAPVWLDTNLQVDGEKVTAEQFRDTQVIPFKKQLPAEAQEYLRATQGQSN